MKLRLILLAGAGLLFGCEPSSPTATKPDTSGTGKAQ